MGESVKVGQANEIRSGNVKDFAAIRRQVAQRCVSGWYFGTTNLGLLYRCCWSFWNNTLFVAEKPAFSQGEALAKGPRLLPLTVMHSAHSRCDVLYLTLS